MKHGFLSSLNSEQAQCVEHSPTVPLQILAGPGSGKTRVLTSRIAYLILHHGLNPASICAVTFTNKAANEMRTRLVNILGKKTNEIKLGTFHSICARFLRKYGHMVGVETNFTVCDSEESKKIVANLLKDHFTSSELTIKEGLVSSMISKAKAKGDRPRDMYRHAAKGAKSKLPKPLQHLVADVYEEYENFLRQNNSLDFDDLLVFGVRLFTENPQHTKWCRHVLVDEFQDTNIIQYELMCCIAAASRCVTVVGDPDQSIYGWRSAEVGNLARMQNDFANVKQIFLELNYRSAGSILDASMRIIAQDKARIPKVLRTSHPFGPQPMLRSFPTENDEASFIAHEINRMMAQTGDMLSYSDFAVLLRFNALSRTIESALQRDRIPNQILGGHKFFERTEIKDLLAYLQLVDNPQFEPAFSRAVNVPSRGIGEKALGEIISRAKKLKASPLSVVERICDLRIPDVRLAVKRKVAPFVSTIRTLRKLATEGTEPSELITKLLDMISYEQHLKETQSDWEMRWENVQELINFASEDIGGGDGEFLVQSPGTDVANVTPLRRFLQASMLSSDGDKSSENGNEKVVITTCHAAKGLEWPVVFIPAVEKGTFPFYRAEDTEEERRLLYVACTRAQTMLYLTHSLGRKTAGQMQGKDVSEFVSGLRDRNPPVFSIKPPILSQYDRKLIAMILGREARLPSEEDIRRRMTTFQASARRYVSPLQTAETDQSRSQYPPDEEQNESAPDGYVPAFQTTEEASVLPIKARPSVLTKRKDEKPRGPPINGDLQPVNARTNDFTCPTGLPRALPLGLREQQKVQPINPSLGTTSSVSVHPTSVSPDTQLTLPPMPQAGVKRRLGMGRGGTGYSNKKFKPPS
ncbi:P-loop containing nucleoside triphosphate hydrolase protein [Phlebopus sp. FC_14]|nr:P-loop containing nucleoside triphosphate hydrolase protein [Phlebopus sp. FC_14]